MLDMKHNIKITAILIGIFLITQLIGLYVVDFYTSGSLPFGMQSPEMQQTDFWAMFPSIIIAFIIAITLIFILQKYKFKFLIRAWFFIVIIIALGISINSAIFHFNIFHFTITYLYWENIPLPWLLAGLIGIPFAIFKIYKPNIIVHNLTEILIYPGIAAVFVPILNIFTIIALLILISLYDMWAVWHSGIMQKMAKYQMNELKIFGGFLIPNISKKAKAQLKKIRLIKSKTKQKSELKKSNIKIQMAILGGGDVVFPIITAGVFMRAFNSIQPALFIIFGALVGLSYLFLNSEKKKFYPAMPFITIGIFAGLVLWIITRIILNLI